MKINRHFSSDVRTGLLPYVRQLRNMSREQLFICAMETREKQLLAQVQHSTTLLCCALLHCCIALLCHTLLCFPLPCSSLLLYLVLSCPILPFSVCIFVPCVCIFVFTISESTHTHTHTQPCNLTHARTVSGIVQA
jgi:hypothetical protein